MKIFIGFIFIYTTISCSYKQYDMAGCVRDAMTKADSLRNVGVNALEEWKKCVIGKNLPDFTVRTLSNERFSISNLKGKIIVINFWFAGCAPCIAEMPGLNRLVSEYGDREIVFLAVSPEPPQYIKENFLTKHRLDFKIVPEANKIIENIMASGYPTTYFIDKSGIIKEAFNGGEIDESAGDIFFNKSKLIIEKLLAE